MTEAGRALLTRCEAIFDELDALRAELDTRASRIEGEVRIGAMEVFSIELLPGALAAIVREHPKVVPLTYEMDPARMERAILDGRIEVGFTIGSGARSGIDSEILGQSTPALVCGRSHPLHGLRANPSRALARAPCGRPTISRP